MTPKITHIETAPVRIVGPSLILRVWAGDEYGIGECYPSGPIAAVNAIVHSLEEHLVGEDPRNVNRLQEKLRRWHIFTGGQAGTVITAISGIEMALWDLAGKLHQAPVVQLFGGAFRERVRLYADCNAGTVDAAGHHPDTSDVSDVRTPGRRERLKSVVEHAVGRGFTALKFDLDDVYGGLTRDEWNRVLSNAQIERMVELVDTLRETVGTEVDLATDMHARFDVPSAVRAAQALEQFDLLWLEEPVPPENIAALAHVRSKTRTPICAGENLYTRYAFLDLLSSGAVDCVMPDIAKFGGLIEGRRVAELAELHYLPFAPHNVSGPIGTVAAAHLCASVSNFSVLEFHALDVDYFESLVTYAAGPVVQDGEVVIVDAPGFGLTLHEDVAREHWHERGGVPFFDERSEELS
ncbi:MAG TPA: mandelate racemase/muconate lactonizing enzyme family protein [Nocardioidaceae bacterium]|nr:mandelate racemase/muconate lactonizing enzyme family protein [Nocardioidaceae bacterium]